MPCSLCQRDVEPAQTKIVLRADYDRLVADNAALRKQLNVAKSNAGSWKAERDALRAEVRALTEERDHLAGLVEQLEYETRPLVEDIDVAGGVL